jgi:hypothetical protein
VSKILSKGMVLDLQDADIGVHQGGIWVRREFAVGHKDLVADGWKPTTLYYRSGSRQGFMLVMDYLGRFKRGRTNACWQFFEALSELRGGAEFT